MRRAFWFCMLIFAPVLSWTVVYAADLYVIPLLESCNCKGTLNGTRWCDNGDGTVTDMNTCLVWLEYASWGGLKPWRNSSTDCDGPTPPCYDDAHNRAALLCDGEILDHSVPWDPVYLKDGSVIGDWRLPTKTELERITTGNEPVSSTEPRAFKSVKSDYYLSSTSGGSHIAWVVHMGGFGWAGKYYKDYPFYVWPVRGGH
jgi:hypothetical protein